MINKKWDGSDLSCLTAEYLSEVLCSMDQNGGKAAAVQFGILGTGLRPNYQINFGDKIVAFSSANHAEDQRTGEFSDCSLSRPFAYAEIEIAMQGKPKTKAHAARLVYSNYKQNRISLPAHIIQYRKEILALVMQGIDVRDAFDRFTIVDGSPAT